MSVPSDDSFALSRELTIPKFTSDSAQPWSAFEQLLAAAKNQGVVMTVYWLLCNFSDRHFPNFATLYRPLVERAPDMGQWVGPPVERSESVDHPESAPVGTSSATDCAVQSDGYSTPEREEQGI